MDMTKELVSLMMGVVFMIALTSFIYSMYEPPFTGVSGNKNYAAEDIASAVSACCGKHAGSYRTYNDDCELLDVNITNGSVTKDMIMLYLSDDCELEMDDSISGERKIKITYLGKEKKVRIITVI